MENQGISAAKNILLVIMQLYLERYRIPLKTWVISFKLWNRFACSKSVETVFKSLVTYFPQFYSDTHLEGPTRLAIAPTHSPQPPSWPPMSNSLHRPCLLPHTAFANLFVCVLLRGESEETPEKRNMCFRKASLAKNCSFQHPFKGGIK